MDKKSILALVVIAIIILTLPYYQKLINGDEPVQKKIAAQEDSLYQKKEPVIKEEKKPAKVISEKQEIVEEKKKPLINIPVIQDSVERTIEINTGRVNVVLSNKGGGSLKKFVLKKYTKYDSSFVNMIDEQIKNDLYISFQSVTGEFIETDRYCFLSSVKYKTKKLKEDEQLKIEYTLKINDNELRKTYIFYGDAYHFDVIVYFSNPAEMLLNRQYQLGWKNGVPSTESYVSDDYTYNQAYVYMADDLESYSVSDEGKEEPVSLSGTASWLAIRTKYFIASISNINADVSEGIYFSGEGIQEEDYVKRLYDVGFNARYKNDRTGDTFRFYIGPLDQKELGKYDNNLDILIMNNGWYERFFRYLSLLVLWVLEFLHSFIPNYGVVIIVFSILIKIVVYPLTKKSYQSMNEMQKIQPIMAELREKYKGDQQRINKEMMKLYKEHGVNPLGGCLPMLLQMPLLIGLFIVFRSTIQLRGACFIPGWVDDLSRTDTLFNLPFSLPMYGNEFNLLPILMAVTMIFQSKMTMQDPKQKAMVYMMPVFMLLIFNRFPSGLNLYYTLFNLLTIIQQKFIKTRDPKEPANAANTKNFKKQKK